MVIELLLYGFITAFGWWGANHYVIEPYFPPTIERKKEQDKKDENDKKDTATEVK